MTDDLVQRLRRTYRKEYAPTGPICGDISNRLRPFPILASEVLFNPDGREAADRIEAQAAEIARLQTEAQAQYDRGYYDGCANPIVRCDALREALEAAPLIGRTESVYDFMERQEAWLKGPYRAAMQEQSK